MDNGNNNKYEYIANNDEKIRGWQRIRKGVSPIILYDEYVELARQSFQSDDPIWKEFEKATELYMERNTFNGTIAERDFNEDRPEMPHDAPWNCLYHAHEVGRIEPPINWFQKFDDNGNPTQQFELRAQRDLYERTVLLYVGGQLKLRKDIGKHTQPLNVDKSDFEIDTGFLSAQYKTNINRNLYIDQSERFNLIKFMDKTVDSVFVKNKVPQLDVKVNELGKGKVNTNCAPAVVWDPKTTLPFIVIYTTTYVSRGSVLVSPRIVSRWNLRLERELYFYAKISHYFHQQAMYWESYLKPRLDYNLTYGVEHGAEVYKLTPPATKLNRVFAESNPFAFEQQPDLSVAYPVSVGVACQQVGVTMLHEGSVLGSTISKNTKEKFENLRDTLPDSCMIDGDVVAIDNNELSKVLESGYNKRKIGVREITTLNHPCRLYSVPWHEHVFGVMTKCRITSGTPVCVYWGEIEEQVQHHTSHYVYSLTNREGRQMFGRSWHIPSLDFDANKFGHIGRFVNDPHFMFEHYGKIIEPNVTPVWCIYKKKPVLVLVVTKTVEKDHELLVDYGEGFWDVMLPQMLRDHAEYHAYIRAYLAKLAREVKRVSGKNIPNLMMLKTPISGQFRPKLVDYPVEHVVTSQLEEDSLARGVYTYEYIVDHKIDPRDGELWYVKWANWDWGSNTWERTSSFPPEMRPQLKRKLDEHLAAQSRVAEMLDGSALRDRLKKQNVKIPYCTCCSYKTSPEFLIAHQLFGVPMCVQRVDHYGSCHAFYGKVEEWDDYFTSDLKYCRWCGDGGELQVCSECTVPICSNCLIRNWGGTIVEDVKRVEHFYCPICRPAMIKPLVELFNDWMNQQELGGIMNNKKPKLALANQDMINSVNNAKAAVNNSKAVVNNAKAAVNNAKAAVNNAKVAVNDTKTVVNNAKAAVNNTKAVANNAKAAVNNTKSVVNNAKAVNNTKAVVNNAKAAVNNTKAVVNNAKAAVNNTKAVVNNAKAAVNNTKIVNNTKTATIPTIEKLSNYTHENSTTKTNDCVLVKKEPTTTEIEAEIEIESVTQNNQTNLNSTNDAVNSSNNKLLQKMFVRAKIKMKESEITSEIERKKRKLNVYDGEL